MADWERRRPDRLTPVCPKCNANAPVMCITRLPSTLYFGCAECGESWRVTKPVKVFHGPNTFTCGPYELITLTVVRNGRLHIKSFVEHHIALGVKHLVVLDNGSDDDTVARLCSYERVTVLRCDLPYSRYENALK